MMCPDSSLFPLTVNVDHAAAATSRVEQVAATVADADGPKGVSNDGTPTRLFEPPVLRELSCSEKECIIERISSERISKLCSIKRLNNRFR